MEGRILIALETSAAQRTRSGAGPRRVFALDALRGSGLLRWAPVAALAAIAVAWGIGHYAHRTGSVAQNAAAPRMIAPAAKSDDVAPQKIVAAPSAASSQVVASQRRRGELVHVAQPSEPAQTEVADAANVSHPAPPMPPTEEEQLLLRFARRGRSQDLAQVSNERRAAQESREAEEFRAFFEPPVVNGESE